MNKPSLASVRKLLKLRDQAKATYSAADAKLDKIIAAGKVGQTFDLGQLGVYEIVDNFALKNIGWGHGSVRRFDVQKRKAS